MLTPHVQAVIHVGGVLADATLQRQSAAGVRTVRAPKGGSLEALAAGLAPQPTAMHVMFSSLAAMLPSAGQANYAAANAELDTAANACAPVGRCLFHFLWFCLLTV